ncbi:ProQ/FINO family protein [Xenorhabdus sp. KJ12.1]|uniref:ProQ/FINO family protein n=1 Tax=Xenorhabdus sp. KJ12.1 TaxID=1851571 RepID=UPI000C048FB7|nr:ProQ/FinO family protein [Xenorhabdus sp. KJ12.1]PHM72293.1 RNA chaperone ProQ [Xenorhabdus sp. KJ12.1]
MNNARPVLTLKRKSTLSTTEVPDNSVPKSLQHVSEQQKKTKKQKNIDRIAKHWGLFNEPKAYPLMVGIDKQIITDAVVRGLDVTESNIKKGLYAYVNRKIYLKALIAGGSRFDMNGQPNGEVTPEQQEGAKQKLVEWQQERQ